MGTDCKISAVIGNPQETDKTKLQQLSSLKQNLGPQTALLLANVLLSNLELSSVAFCWLSF